MNKMGRGIAFWEDRIQRLALGRFVLLVLRALGHDGRPKPCAQIVGEFVEFRITVDFDGLASGIADDIAVVAPRQMIVQFGLGPGVQHAVEVVG
jgi:hypothetical protein